MTFPILGGNGAVAGYSIDNSLRFNDDDSTYLYLSQTAGNRRTLTFSTWLKRSTLGDKNIFNGTDNSSEFTALYFTSADELFLYDWRGAEGMNIKTTQKFRDTSAWYHIVIAFDTTQSTASNRVKFYVNGEQITDFTTSNYPAQNLDLMLNVNSSFTTKIGVYPTSNTLYFDGYMAETCLIEDSQLTPTSFGETDESSGIWKPIDISGLTFGDEGFYLKYENTADAGEDSSGNGNNFTGTGMGASDHVTDTPTNNFATLNPLTFDSSGMTFSEGNTKVIGVAGSNSTAVSAQSFSSGKWYAEFKIGNTHKTRLGAKGTDWYDKNNTQIGTVYDQAGYIYIGTQESGSDDLTPPSYTTGDIIGVFVDKDNNTIKFSKNGTVHSVSQTLSQDEYAFYVFDYSGTGDNQLSVEANFGNPSFSISSGNSDVNGYGNFEYSPNDGTYDYLALCTQNLATALSPTIDDGSQYFNSVLYSGNSGSNSVTGVGFQPDFLWIKSRNAAENHVLFNSNVGAGSQLRSNTTGAETSSAYIDSFDTDGFSMNTALKDTNFSSYNYVSWSWLASGGTTSSNTDGSITSTVQANTTAGFSIVTYTGTGSNATVGHGLGKAPSFLVTKSRSTSGYGWVAWHSTLAGNEALELNLSDAKITSATSWNSTVPTSSVFSVGTRLGTNASGTTYVAYCFAEIEGYSKFGSYTGNGNSDGTFVYTGFRPAFLIVKNTSITSEWMMWDNKRDTFNVVDARIYPNRSYVESTGVIGDFLSNGVKIRNSGGWENGSGNTIIYMAFAENPFVDSNGIPVTAR